MRFVALPPPAGHSSELILAAVDSADDDPLGIAIAEHQDGNELARIPSIVVDPAHQNQGVATALLAELESRLRARGARKLEILYEARGASSAMVYRLLEKRGFSLSHGVVMCTGSIRVLDAPWMQVPIPEEDDLFSWTELSTDEARAIRSLGGYPPELDPFAEEPFEPINSLGLRRDGEVIAWLITHRKERDMISYSRLFVRPGRRSQARGVALVAEAIRRQVAGGVYHAVFFVRSDNAPMLRFVDRRAAPHLDAISETMVAAKVL